jgi:hypothetical protein
MLLLDLFRNADLPSFATLFHQINIDMGNGKVWELVIFACGMLAVHGFAVLAIAGAYHFINQFLINKKVAGGSFIAYFIAILLVIASHLSEIVMWTYICVGLKVFPTNPQTFYFAGEMYTTVGYGDYKLAEQWRVLPIIISFTGIFAVSMSGAALYSMMGALLNRPSQNPKSGTGF